MIMCEKITLYDSNNNGYFQVIFLTDISYRAHGPFINKTKNVVNIELGKTNRLKALCMMQNNT